ncbi:ROK family transcriptional regulator [Nonomuraea sp. SMC257]|uniref:ROK family transcriptional regulator n=1 Tax=Nonomuraea montanisoli TaxID=2741721 RepID=A0A7Y6IF40_9ACTN|nr:ROK family transcriptional regulator [Nonomuraea montanisoli]NUW35604.1 ROK family transcriptional regulator [Nonomuraea montanisoli]
MIESAPPHWFGAPLSRATTVAALRVIHADAAWPPDDDAPGGLTLTEIAQRAGVSRPSTEDAVDELLERELIAEIEPDPDAPRPVGRPAKRYRFRSELGYVLGVDIGIHKVLALCTDLAGNVRGSHRIEVSAELSNADRIQAARTALKRAARASSVRLADILAVGVGTTGPVDPHTGTVVRSPALVGWTGVNVKQELSGIGTGPVLVGNDANLGALAEHWRGAAGDASDVVYILAGHQVSVGILIDGRVREGRHGAAGEIGVLEAARWYEARDALAAGKPLDEPGFIDALATGIAAAVLLVDPDKVIIGGGLSQAGDTLLKPLRRRLEELCLFPIPVQASHLGEQNVALGAVRQALDHLESPLFTTQ